MRDLEDRRNQNKKLAKGKSSKDCTFEEAVKVYRQTVGKAETREERLRRINDFRCGW